METTGMERMSYYFEQNYVESGLVNVIQVLKTCDAFARNGVDVTLYAPSDGSVSQKEVFELYGIGETIKIRPIVRFPYVKFILNTLGMFCYMLRDDSPVIFTRNFYLAYMATYLNKTVVLESHQHTFDQGYHTRFFNFILKRIDGRKNVSMVVISKRLKEILNDRGIKSPMLVCHDGYDDCTVCDGSGGLIDRTGYRATAVYAGSLLRIKGFEHIERLARKNPDVKFCLLGDYRQKADRQIVERMRPLSNVEFTGLIRHAEINGYLSEADVLLLLPTKEGVYNDVTSPLKMFEYMNTGNAILATDMPSLAEVLVSGRNCMMANDDPDDIDSKFQMLINDGGLRERLGSAAREDVKEYSWLRRSARIMEFVSGRTGCSG